MACFFSPAKWLSSDTKTEAVPSLGCGIFEAVRGDTVVTILKVARRKGGKEAVDRGCVGGRGEGEAAIPPPPPSPCCRVSHPGVVFVFFSWRASPPI